jgi:hypothetical protein
MAHLNPSCVKGSPGFKQFDLQFRSRYYLLKHYYLQYLTRTAPLLLRTEDHRICKFLQGKMGILCPHGAYANGIFWLSRRAESHFCSLFPDLLLPTPIGYSLPLESPRGSPESGRDESGRIEYPTTRKDDPFLFEQGKAPMGGYPGRGLRGGNGESFACLN